LNTTNIFKKEYFNTEGVFINVAQSPFFFTVAPKKELCNDDKSGERPYERESAIIPKDAPKLPQKKRCTKKGIYISLVKERNYTS
jgi:hypothetical protein